jgi:hypothetical protein
MEPPVAVNWIFFILPPLIPKQVGVLGFGVHAIFLPLYSTQFREVQLKWKDERGR